MAGGFQWDIINSTTRTLYLTSTRPVYGSTGYGNIVPETGITVKPGQAASSQNPNGHADPWYLEGDGPMIFHVVVAGDNNPPSSGNFTITFASSWAAGYDGVVLFDTANSIDAITTDQNTKIVPLIYLRQYGGTTGIISRVPWTEAVIVLVECINSPGWGLMTPY